MKKINLKGVSEILSEKELKNVMGGSSICFHCMNGGTGSCAPPTNCLTLMTAICPGGWTQWPCY